MKLTAAQQKDITDSIWVVNSALKKLGFSYDEDLRQQAILYMCRCRMRFDESRNVKWTTYAYSNIYMYLKRTLKARFEKEKKKHDFLIKVQPDVSMDIIDEYTDKIDIENIKSICNEKERMILELRLQGKTYSQISVILNISETYATKRMRNIINEAIEHFNGGVNGKDLQILRQ